MLTEHLLCVSLCFEPHEVGTIIITDELGLEPKESNTVFRLLSAMVNHPC